MLKVGDIVRTVREIRTNPVVAERRGWDPVPRHAMGVVLDVRDSGLNKDLHGGKHGCIYVDVHLFDDGTGKPWKAGNYHSGSFEKIL